MTYGVENEKFVSALGVAPSILRDATVVVELPECAAKRADAAAAFVLTSNLMARLFHRVHLVGPDAPLGAHPWSAGSTRGVLPILASLSEGTVVWGAPRAPADVVIGVGATPTVTALKSVVVGFAPGIARIDREGASEGEDVLAALVAACFGAAQAFLHVASQAGAALAPNAPFAMLVPGRAPSASLDLGTVHVAGIGAIGSALVYGLGHLSCRGKLVAIDPDDVDMTNLQRYVLMRSSDMRAYKVDVAERALAGRAMSVSPFCGSYQSYRHAHPTDRVERLVSAVDSPAGRRALARSIPHRIINASTSDRLITVSRHGFADGRACLFCLYADRAPATSQEARIARDLGLSKAQVERLLAENARVDAALVAGIEAHLGVTPGTHSAWINQPLASFYQRAFCGGATVATAAGTIVAPLAFISAAAGLLSLAELVGGVAAGDEAERPNYLRLDTLGSPDHADRDDRLPDPHTACICHDSDYVDVYRSRFGATALRRSP